MNQAPTPQPMTPECRRENFLAGVILAGYSTPTQRWAEIKVDDLALYLPTFGERNTDDIGPAPHGGANARLTMREKTTGTRYTIELEDIAAALQVIARTSAEALRMSQDTRALVLSWDDQALRPDIDPAAADQVIQVAALGAVTHR